MNKVDVNLENKNYEAGKNLLNTEDETRNDDFVRNFFAENIHDVADNGFSERVMKRLPKRKSKFWLADMIWKTVCGISIVLYIIFTNSISVILNIIGASISKIVSNFSSIPVNAESISILVLAIIAIDLYVGKEFLKGEINENTRL